MPALIAIMVSMYIVEPKVDTLFMPVLSDVQPTIMIVSNEYIVFI